MIFCAIFVDCSMMMMVMNTLVAGDDSENLGISSSIFRLTRMVETEERLVRTIRDFLVGARKQLTGAEQLWSELHLAQPPALYSRRRDDGHPIEAVHLFHRYIKLWKHRLDSMRNTTQFNGLVKTLGRLLDKNSPSDSDCEGAYLAIVRLQEIYRLPAQTLSLGHLLNRFGTNLKHPAPRSSLLLPRAPSMDVKDCRNLAIVAMGQGLYEIALDWIQLAIKRYKPDKQTLRDLKDFRKFARAGIKATKTNAFDPEDDIISMDEPDFTVSFNAPSGVEQRREQTDEDEVDELENVDDDEILLKTGFQYVIKSKSNWQQEYGQLCRKDMMTSKTEKLFCRVRRATMSYLVWKEEIVNLEPFIAIYYDFLSDEETHRLINISIPLMESSRIMLNDNTDGSVNQARVANTAYLELGGGNDGFLALLNGRCEDVTGLDCTVCAEPLQVAVYGMAGQYDPHFDFSQRPFLSGKVGQYWGDRIATLIVYLSDVEAGGLTAFPRRGVAIKPIQNAAVFWYNLNPDGTPDDCTLHGGCPVLLGHKWIATKWIHERGQIWRRPCPQKY